jgi:uncharacterized protein YndB with AHSA1/START domain
MPRTLITRTIAAPPARVFSTVADIAHFAQAIPEIVKVEFLSPQKTGVGTRFRETRKMGGREMPTELAVTEFVPNERVRLVADNHGTVWDTTFSVKPVSEGTLLTVDMEARSATLRTKFQVWLIRGLVKRAIAKDMDRVKEYCERPPATSDRAQADR